MTAITWLAVVVLGVGSICIFVFFLRDARGILESVNHRTEQSDNRRYRDANRSKVDE